jgi:hypothetical protein
VSTLRSCKLDKKYRDLKAAYETDRKVFEADHALSLAHIEQLANAVASADKVIVQKEADIAVKNARILVLSGQLDDLAHAEPSQPELESQPLVINLRGRVAKLTEMFTLSQGVVTLQAEEITALKGKCIALESIGNEWRVSYDKEHALRLSAEKLVLSLEKRVKSQGLLGKVKTVALGVASGYVAYSILKHR